jgi:WD40 repeat protein/Flp pilus assembly protein TadD
VAFDATGDVMMTSGWGNTALWEPLTGRRLVRSIERGVGFSKDGRWLALSVPGVVTGRWEVASRPEYFTLSGHPRDPFVYAVAFHPDGRLLASATGGDGIRLWDAYLRKEVARLDFGGSCAAFSSDGRALFVGGSGRETYRIPLATDAQDGKVLVRLGAPQQLFPKGSDFANVSFTADGRTLATTVQPTSVVVVDVDEPPRRRVEIKGDGLRFHDFSPDGTLIAIGNWDGADCGVWDAKSGELVKRLSNSGSARVRFSPDGRTLACNRFDECTLWDVKSWTPRYCVPHEGSSYGVAAFSSDSRLAAVTTPNAVKLIDLADGREVATLYAPTTLEAKSICFSPDGRYLAVGTRRHAIRVWDVSLVRAKLRGLGVDWSHPPVKEAPENTPPLEVQIDPRLPLTLAPPPYFADSRADVERLTSVLAKQPKDVTALWQRARAYIALGQEEEAIADCDRALAIDPENQHPYFWRARANLNLNRCADALADFRKSHTRRADDDWCLRHMAWILVAGPPELRNAAEARQFAEEAVKLSAERQRSNPGLFLATLGMAHYRMGDDERALATLDKAVTMGGADSRTLLFLALCHAQLGSGESARLCFEEATRLIRGQFPDGHGDVTLILAEVAQVLESSEASATHERTP